MTRQPIYPLLLVVTAGLTAGRIVSTGEKTLGANDASRWATVRALVHDGTYEIGRRVAVAGGGYEDRGIVAEPGWDTVDKVLHPDSKAFYSSKPPLFSTAVAGVYQVVYDLTGWSITSDKVAVVWLSVMFVSRLPFRYQRKDKGNDPAAATLKEAFCPNRTVWD